MARNFVGAGKGSANFDRTDPSREYGNDSRSRGGKSKAKKNHLDETPSIDRPPRDNDDSVFEDRGDGTLIPVGQAAAPRVRGDMSQEQRRNQEIGAQRALAEYTAFSKDLPKIRELLESKEQEGAITLIQRSILMNLLGALELAFDKYTSSPMDFNAYALAAMLTQVRNVITDLQASRDRSAITQRVNMMMRTAMVLIVQHASELNAQTKAMLNDKLKPEYVKSVSLDMDSSLRQLVRFMDEHLEQLKEDIGKILTE